MNVERNVKDMLIIAMLLVVGTCKVEAEEMIHQDVSLLVDLPLSELLSQKKYFECGNSTLEDDVPVALPLVRKSSKGEEVTLKGYHKLPARKAFYDHDYDDEKGWVHHYKKKEKDKYHDILNTSLTALSYLAFGGYLLCMIVSSIREKRRRIMTAYGTTAGPVQSGQVTNVLQQYLTQRPIRIRFPAVTVHQGGKKRKRRSQPHPYGYYQKEDEQFSIIYMIDYVEDFSQKRGW